DLPLMPRRRHSSKARASTELGGERTLRKSPPVWRRSNPGFSNLPASGDYHWPCHLVRAVDEKLRRRRQCAVLQGDDANRSGRREVDWQNFDGAFPAAEPQNGFRSHREEVPLRDK